MLASIYRKGLFLFVLLSVPLVGSAQVVINEVQILPTGERFIELYNQGSTPVNLTDWFIQRKTSSGTTFGSLVSKTHFEGKVINANGYFLISRSSFTNSDIVLDSLTLTESNTILLKNSEGEVDKVGWGSVADCQSPCPANPAEGQSIQKISSEWVIASPTPRAVNSSSVTTSTTTESDTASSTTTTTTSSSSGNSTSAHYSSAPLSTKKIETPISISAGRDRLGSVGSPMEFKVETNSELGRNSNYRWNFGDGSEGAGEVLTHTYSYPGEYVVVLNADLPQGKAVSRINVKIVAPEIVVTSANGERIELRNNAKSEVSLYGRVLWSGGKAFSFAQDTIIKAGQSISFSSKITGLSPTIISDVQLLTVGEVEQPKLISKIEEEKNLRVTELQKELTGLHQQLADLSVQRQSATVVQVAQAPSNSPPESVVTQEIVEVVEPIMESKAPQTATALEGVKEGWWSMVKRFFLRTR